MIEHVLVANRGEIARRVIRTCRRLGITVSVVHSTSDQHALHVLEADHAVCVGDGPPSASYLRDEAIIDATRSVGAEAIHPGYGFLSENAGFARAVIDADLIWIGPSPEVIDQMSDKGAARQLMAAAGVPVAPGSREPVLKLQQAVTAAEEIGYPIMLKPALGGGGIGMAVVTEPAELPRAFEAATARSQSAFGAGALVVEKFIESARHIEVQILGLPDGRVVALGERDCSLQRRHQKIVEESPSPGLNPTVRDRLITAAIRAGEAVAYRGAGTVEFLVNAGAGRSANDLHFLEMNTRLQVEHPVTEMRTGIDLVEQQLLIAANEPVSFDPDDIPFSGHAIEMRICAEDPVRFLPSPGTISVFEEPTGAGVRVDSGYRSGDAVSPYYDSLIAKVIVHGADRVAARQRALDALDGLKLDGVTTNVDYLRYLVAHSAFAEGQYDTRTVEGLKLPRPTA